MEDTVNKILKTMSSVKKPQRTFIAALLSVLMIFQGRATFRNLSRYCEMSEKRMSRWYRRSFDFTEFNFRLLSEQLPEGRTLLAAIDASFMEKSGKKTEGLARFHNGKTGLCERGLELSSVSIIDLQANTAYHLDARQTMDHPDHSRVESYARQAVELATKLKSLGVSYMVIDAYYSKKTFIPPIMEAGLHVVGKLRIDADLLWLYEGKYSGRGRPKRYDGKINAMRDKHRFICEGETDAGEGIYTAIVYSKMLKRPVRVVMLCRGENYTLLFSTDTALDASTLIAWYKARFQIEFVFRDARQYTGLTHCQSLKQEAIHTHINASLTALNLMKLQDRKAKNTETPTVISIASWKRRKRNQHLMCRLFDKLDLSLNDQKVSDVYTELSEYGTIAA